jgi:hypothetical protein
MMRFIMSTTPCIIVIQEGCIIFNPVLLRSVEWLDAPAILRYWDVDSSAQHLEVPVGAFAFTLCRVPFVIQQADQNQLTVQLRDGTEYTLAEHRLDSDLSHRIFSHDGFFRQITISYEANTI